MAQLVQATLDGPTNPPLISGLFLQTPIRCTALLELEAHCSVLHGCLLIADGILTQSVLRRHCCLVSSTEWPHC